MIPLEDGILDVIGKAQRGLQIPEEDISGRAGISESEWSEIQDGKGSPQALTKIAAILQLKATALVELAQKSWAPQVTLCEGLQQFNTPYLDMTVNSYLVWDPQTRFAVAFDTGADCEPMLLFADTNELRIRLILLTHTHGDHVYDLPKLKQRTNAPSFVSEREPVRGADTFAEGKTFEAGNLKIETRLTWGHSKGGTTYVVTGLAVPVAVVGDAIFASSMGGGMVSYQDALKTNHEKILTLPGNTIVCPGHGPLTTVADEMKHNPFFPEN